MVQKSQITGMRGVFLAAAYLSKLGFVVSPTSRNTAGADLLVTDQDCTRAMTVQVKANAKSSSFWLVGKEAVNLVSSTHFYVLVNGCDGDEAEYFVVPSRVVAKRTRKIQRPNSVWYSIRLKDINAYRSKWKAFGSP
jgi:hypothetical protein